MIQQSINPRARRLSLRVDHREGVIKLTIPKWTLQRSIDRFLNTNKDWIAEKSATLSPKVTIENGEVIPFMGDDYKIVIEHHTKRTTDISLSSSLHGLTVQSRNAEGLDYTYYSDEKTCNDDRYIIIKTSRPDPTSNLKRWMIDQARQAIEPLSQEKAKAIGKSISKIDLRDTSSRWGSCSTDKRLMFSWRLIMAPTEVLDYVVAHEVAHLKHMDHSAKFWDLCYDLTNEDADSARQWLRDSGNSLMRYF